jgi:hypothetical protein
LTSGTNGAKYFDTPNFACVLQYAQKFMAKISAYIIIIWENIFTFAPQTNQLILSRYEAKNLRGIESQVSGEQCQRPEQDCRQARQDCNDRRIG